MEENDWPFDESVAIDRLENERDLDVEQEIVAVPDPIATIAVLQEKVKTLEGEKGRLEEQVETLKREAGLLECVEKAVEQVSKSEDAYESLLEKVTNLDNDKSSVSAQLEKRTANESTVVVSNRNGAPGVGPSQDIGARGDDRARTGQVKKSKRVAQALVSTVSSHRNWNRSQEKQYSHRLLYRSLR